MHLYMITRGIKPNVDQFITELQGKYLPFKCPNPQGDPKVLVPFLNQIHVRPIQLWEIVFPEEHKDAVLNTVLTPYPHKKHTQHSKHEKWIWAMRKGLGAEEIPDYKKEIKFPISDAGVERIGIGIKKDYWQDCRDEKRYDHKANEFCFEGL
jgi:hypothetical protein